MATYPPLPTPTAPSPGRAVEKYRRNRRGEIAIWWREIDRSLLLLVVVLMAMGSAAVAAASPAAAHDEPYSTLYFFTRNCWWQAMGLALMLGASMLSKDNARRVGIVLAGVMLFALMLVPLIGEEANGARRWLNAGVRFQPSEFLKPGFAITLAWLLSWRVRDPSLPVVQIGMAIIAVIAALLMLQPNLGETILFAGIWFVLTLLSGLPVRRMVAIGVTGLAGLAAAYIFYDNARYRIESFLGGGTAFDQVDLAQRTLLNGGWTGTGFWLGTRKFALPEAHTDYIFSVIGEEFGLLGCMIIVALYLAIVIRILFRLVEEEDLFTVLAGAGLAAQLGGQAFINIMVNLQMFPSKGMTLPLISYGGSSTLAICLSVGLLLAITRRNPFIERQRFSLKDIGVGP